VEEQEEGVHLVSSHKLGTIARLFYAARGASELPAAEESRGGVLLEECNHLTLGQSAA
jgi:hypothetical protein